MGVQLAVKVRSWLLLVHAIWRSGYTLLSHHPVPIFRPLRGTCAVCITSDELLCASHSVSRIIAIFFSPTSDLPEILFSALYRLTQFFQS